MDSLVYGAAVEVCAYFRETEKVRYILRRFNVPDGDKLLQWVCETNSQMTVNELWSISQLYRPERRREAV